MSTLQQTQFLVDEIRGLLYVAAPDEEKVVRLARQFQDAIVVANNRLSRCSSLLRQGLRTEALQQCEEEPNLVELVSLLDFPERLQWLDLLVSEGIRQPPELMLELAVELNGAYASDPLLNELMKKHRMLALGRAPLAARIRVLRKIIELDGNNEKWIDDLQEYELAEINQIGSRAKKAFEGQDLNTLTHCLRELKSKGWKTSPPKELVSQVAHFQKSILSKETRKRLISVEERLNQAHAAFDLAAGRATREEWNELYPMANFNDGDELPFLVQPALQWLEEIDTKERSEQRHFSAITALEMALDNEDADLGELTSVFQAANHPELPIPSVLKRRFHERVLALELLASRRRRMIYASAGVLLVAFSVGLGWIVSSRALANRIRVSAH